MVWALDNAGNIYVREGIFPYHPVGTGWVHVPDIKASHLTIRYLLVNLTMYIALVLCLIFLVFDINFIEFLIYKTF